MTNKSLKFNLSISVPDAELTVENLDIDFDIYKNNTPENNRAYINIWNLENSRFQQLIESDSIVNISTSFGEETPVVIFRGFLEYNKIKRGFPPGRVDNATNITLTDGYKAVNTFINKNYRQEVNSTQIIKDIIREMSIDEGIISDELPSCNYNSFKAYGFAHVILREICTPLGIKFNILNNVINLTSDTDTIDEEGYLLNEENCSLPEKYGKNGVILRTSLTPNLLPDDIIQCDFENLKGTFRINEIHHYGNNYGRSCLTEIRTEVNADE